MSSLFYLMLLSFAFDGQTAVDHVLALCKKQESAVQTCHVKYRWKISHKHSENREVEVWADGDRIRADILGRVTPSGEKEPKITCGHNWPSPGNYVYFNRKASPAILEKNVSRHLNWMEMQMYEGLPHRIGLNPVPIASTSDMPWDFLIRSRKNIIESKVNGSDDLISLKGIAGQNASHETIHSRQFDYYPVLHKLSATAENNHYVSEIKNELKRDPKTGIVFVTALDRWQKQNGQFTSQEVFEVIECQFNEKIDPKVFELADLEIARGIEVRYELKNDNSTKYWDGTKVVNEQLPDIQKKIDKLYEQKVREIKEKEIKAKEVMQPTPANQKPASYTMYYVIGILFFAFGIFYFARRLFVRSP